jgi:hypothetical protein
MPEFDYEYQFQVNALVAQDDVQASSKRAQQYSVYFKSDPRLQPAGNMVGSSPASVAIVCFSGSYQRGLGRSDIQRSHMAMAAR